MFVGNRRELLGNSRRHLKILVKEEMERAFPFFWSAGGSSLYSPGGTCELWGLLQAGADFKQDMA